MLKYIKTLFIIFISMLLFLTACTNTLNLNPTVNTTQAVEPATDNNTPIEIKALICVNGEMLKNENTALISSDFIEIPFVCVFEALGANVVWESDSKATISYKGENYILDVDAQILRKAYIPNSNYLFGPTGGTFILYSQNKEVVSDSYTLTFLFDRLGIDVNINYDKKNNIVYITEQP